jgi:hypothetical protein
MMIVNERKTKYMKCGRRKTNGNKLEIKTMEFEKVQSFKYLDSVVNQHNEIKKLKKNKYREKGFLC